jgi:xylulose-5-phosphate/fructose-6-phosphate phosphoketolase
VRLLALGKLSLATWQLLLVSDVIDRVPKLGARAACAKQAIRDKLMEHKAYIARHGDDMPEITGWQWGQEAGSSAGGHSTEADNV